MFYCLNCTQGGYKISRHFVEPMNYGSQNLCMTFKQMEKTKGLY